MTKRKKLSKRVKIFRHIELPVVFCLLPIARDHRIKCKWKYSDLPGIAYEAPLKGAEDKVTLYWVDDSLIKMYTPWPKRRTEPRAPTAACMNLLLAVLHYAIDNDTNILEFKTLKEFRRKIKLFWCWTNLYYSELFADAMRLWQCLGISWPKVDLPPPFQEIKINRRFINDRAHIKITIHEEWMKFFKERGKVRVRLPLPMTGTSMNMILYCLGLPKHRWKYISIPEFGYRVSGNRKCITQNLFSLESWIVVQQWFENNGGSIKWERTPYSYGRDHRGFERLIPSDTFSILSIKRP